jgi:hypothetical protein
MKYFLDTEFIEYPNSIQLISIGIVCEDGREYYAESNEFDESKANDWVRENVISQLADPNKRRSLRQIRLDIMSFVIYDDIPEFWGYYCDYDWVVFCWLFGGMIDLPKGWPMYCNDLKQWCYQLGDPSLPEQKSTGHNALADAYWNMQIYGFLEELEDSRRGQV